MEKMRELGLNDLDAVSGGAAGDSIQSSGFFQSNSGTGLNIQVDWRVVSALSGGKTLEVDVSSLSYSLYSAALQNGVELSVNGALYLADSKAVEYGGRNRISSPLASFSIPVSSPSVVSLSAVWRFRGTYSGVSISELRAGGTVAV